MVDVEVIKRLIALMVENDLAEVSLRDGQEEISLKKTPAEPGLAVPNPHGPAPLPAATTPSHNDHPPPSAQDDPEAGLVAVPSPMVGTYYAASDPSSPPFVNVGDSVTPDTVVCIIEAMKVFNEIKAGAAGTIERILVANETAVEYDQPLFMLRPA